MAEVKMGDTVHVNYTGTLKSGEMFDTSEGREPLSFTVGSGQVIKGFDDAVMGMKEGEKKTVHIPVEHAYGPKSQDMMMEFPLTDFPADVKPEEGMELHLSDNDGNVIPVIVVNVGDKTVLLDANHPLAGEDLTFELELVRID